jgi:hypothetical protein
MSSSEEDTSSDEDTLSHMIDEDLDNDDFDDEDDNDLLLLHGGADTPYAFFIFKNSQSHLFIKLDIHTLNKAIMHTYILIHKQDGRTTRG